MDELIAEKYKNLEPEELNNRLQFLFSKIESVKTNIQKKTQEIESMCIEALELIEYINGKKG